MTISKQQLKDAFLSGKIQGIREGEQKVEGSLRNQFSHEKLQMLNAAKELAMANAKLTYAVSQILEKLK